MKITDYLLELSELPLSLRKSVFLPLPCGNMYVACHVAEPELQFYADPA